MAQLQDGVEPGTWLMFDRHRRVAIIRVVTVRGRRLIRSVSYDDDPRRRELIGYFPADHAGLELAAACTWSTYLRAAGPTGSNRR